MEYAMSPSSIASFTPVTVTVLATFQFAGVKITLAGETVPSVVSLELSPIVTGAVGLLLRTIVNVAVRLAGEHHAEVGRASRLGGNQAARRRHVDAGGVVIGVRHRHVARIEAVVRKIAARGPGDDRVTDVAVGDRVIDAGDGHRL